MKKIRIVQAVGIVGSMVTLNNWLLHSAQIIDFILLGLTVLLIHQLLPKKQSKVKAEIYIPANTKLVSYN